MTRYLLFAASVFLLLIFCDRGLQLLRGQQQLSLQQLRLLLGVFELALSSRLHLSVLWLAGESLTLHLKRRMQRRTVRLPLFELKESGLFVFVPTLWSSFSQLCCVSCCDSLLHNSWLSLFMSSMFCARTCNLWTSAESLSFSFSLLRRSNCQKIKHTSKAELSSDQDPDTVSPVLHVSDNTPETIYSSLDLKQMYLQQLEVVFHFQQFSFSLSDRRIEPNKKEKTAIRAQKNFPEVLGVHGRLTC